MATSTAMTIRRWEERLLVEVTPAFEEIGFSFVADLSFGRTGVGTIELISLSDRLDRQGRFWFSYGVGIRFEEIEALLKSNADRLKPTIGVPHRLLALAPQPSEWCVDRESELVGAAIEFRAAVTKWGVPFLAKFSDLRNVERSLCSERPDDWFALSPEQRLAVKAAIAAVDGRRGVALVQVRAALVDLEGALPKKRLVLERLLKSIEALQ
jgi:hypothetical protein